MKQSIARSCRLICVVVSVLSVHAMSGQASAATQETMDPLLARQLMRVMTDADGDISQMLAGLAELAKRKRRPDDLKFIIRERAALLIQEEQLSVARTELQAALAGQPEDYAPALRYLLGQIYLLEGDAAAALAPLEIWARYAPDADPAGLFVLAYALVQLERFDAAATRLESIIADAAIVRPQWIEVLAYVYAQLGRTDQAITLLNDLVAEHPDNARWWRQLATVYLIIENVPRGTAGFTIATELAGMEFADARRLARLFGFLDMPADGADLLQQAMTDSAEPVSYEDQMLLAELWIVAREFDAAIAALQAASLIAEDGEPLMVMGQLYLQRERFEPAREALIAASAAYAEQATPLVYYLLAVAQLNAGDLAAAELTIEEFSQDPEFSRRAASLRDYIRSVAEQ